MSNSQRSLEGVPVLPPNISIRSVATDNARQELQLAIKYTKNGETCINVSYELRKNLLSSPKRLICYGKRILSGMLSKHLQSEERRSRKDSACLAAKVRTSHPPPTIDAEWPLRFRVCESSASFHWPETQERYCVSDCERNTCCVCGDSRPFIDRNNDYGTCTKCVRNHVYQTKDLFRSQPSFIF
eukprot:1192589-Prorocentrum_minimum.AAC.2